MKILEIAKKLIVKFRRFISYGIVGVINTLVDYGVFSLLYSLAGAPVALSQAAGYMSGSVCGYLLNSNITFREGKGRTRAQFVQYLAVDLALALLSSAVMDYFEALGVNAYLLKIVMTVVIMLLHYVIFKHLIFRIKKEDTKND